MAKRILLLIVTLVIVVLVASSLLLINASHQPHVALISEVAAEEFSGQNYTLSTLTIETGSTLAQSADGNRMIQGVTYSIGSQAGKNGSYFYFQDVILEFNTTSMAQTDYQIESGLFGFGVPNLTGNGAYKGFHYLYTSTSMMRQGSAYYWGATGYSGNFVFVIEGQAPWPLNTNVSNVAIEQINLMTSVYL